MENRYINLVFDHVGQHQRHEAQKEAEEYRQHESGDPRVLSALKAARFPSGDTCMGLQVLSALPHAPINAQVGDADDHAGHDEPQHEQELLWAGAVLLENRTGEGGRLQT